ncbi:ATP-binding protein [Spirosoma sp. RP8]|uniref:ATP-binding protein n=1 Tax=Spirosoma liriopis TaxID=2937440 RepID=A0ABT0HLX3_9BACT|nr:ATP-binding protein [Spirosoma liriopis]MCK8493158.1 ATP-binding protein [Spirosoma liriopis]
MDSYERTSLWQKTLAYQGQEDPHNAERETLRNAYKLFRDKAQILASEINRSLPDFTVHDITHIDALWEMADLVTDCPYPLTPTEAFVLGGAFLIHDLGMGLAAYQNGIEQLRDNQTWKDTLAAILKRNGQSPNTPLENISTAFLNEADSVMLRTLHAKHAVSLAESPFIYNGNQYYLIENLELRQSFGHYIGQIAYSHWWDIDKLEAEFYHFSGVAGKFPNDWTVDLLKLACLIRVADVTQIDDRRAPLFLQILRKPYGYSRQHWDFQSNLNQPIRSNGRLRYTSKAPFRESDVDSFWTCYETLQVVDKELNDVDALLTSTRPNARLNVFGVEGVGTLHHLVKLIRVDGWTPIDTSVKVANVADLVGKLGGEQLYSKDKFIPIRELVQNSLDALQARRLLDGNSQDWGDILIKFDEDKFGCYIEIEDNGVGMSSQVITKSFLNFGESFWSSSLMHEELPGLESSNFNPVGKYGIGFYSVFMLGNRVIVRTRKYDAGRNDTLVLDFKNNVNKRPLLRKALRAEELKDGGTSIKIWLPDFRLFQNDSDGILKPSNFINKEYLEVLLKMNFPSISANLSFKIGTDNPQKIVSSNDWLKIEPLELMQRLFKETDYKNSSEEDKNKLAHYLDNMKIITNKDNKILGRAFIYENEFFQLGTGILKGAVTVGGIASNSLNGIGGILIGNSIMASRELALPDIDEETLSNWASEQAYLIEQKKHLFTQETLLSLAGNVHNLRGNIQNLPFCYVNDKILNCTELKNYISEKDLTEIIISERWLFGEHKYYKLPPNLSLFYIMEPMHSYVIKDKYLSRQIHWPAQNSYEWFYSRLRGLFLETIAEVWNISKLEELMGRNGVFYENEKNSIEIQDEEGQLIKVDTHKIIKPFRN